MGKYSQVGWCGLLTAMLLSGCASSGGSPGVFDKALEMFGVTKPAPPEISADSVRAVVAPRKITLRLHASDSLNTDANGRALSTVTRIYKLRNATALQQAPYAVFQDPAAEKLLLGNDVVEMREVVLTPGKKYEVIETMPIDAGYIAVVALLRSPDAQRWRFVFDAKEAARSGITIGVHACALSVAEGEPLGVPAEVRRLAGVRCAIA